MASWNQEFSNALNEITQLWITTMIEIIERGKLKGLIRKEVNSSQVTMFVMSGYWGIRNFGKLANDKLVYDTYLKELKYYLETLK